MIETTTEPRGQQPRPRRVSRARHRSRDSAPQGRIQPETPIKRGTPEWSSLYKRRTSVEREFGRLKHEYGLAFVRVRDTSGASASTLTS